MEDFHDLNDSMAVPFHRLCVCGSILVAARGASIHTFSADGSHIAAWQAPPAGAGAGAAGTTQEDGAAGDEDAPPSKRRRVEETENGDGHAHAHAHGATQKKSKGDKTALRTADPPVVSILEATADGRHLVAMLGHDKTLRVLAHDGAGRLTQLSARPMPKRPSAVAFTADGQTILSGDKFGDVYAVPLLEGGDKTAGAETSVTPAADERTAAPLQLAGNQFTVHTKGNRQALENQRRQREQQRQQGLEAPKRDLASAYQLLLGHVSMLTAVAVAEGYRDGERAAAGKAPRRPLILTADRDEHIRVTRGVVGATPAASQTHVIETFCLGHTSFVSQLCIPAARPDRLVSGGGDGVLRVWRFWPQGEQVGTADLASLVAAVAGEDAPAAPAAPKVALARLYAFDASLVALCERVPALFFFALAGDGATLAHTQTLPLPGQLPLDVALVDGRLVVAAAAADGPGAEDAAAPASLLALARDGAGWTAAAAPFASLAAAATDDALDRGALRRFLLHSNESLRKDSEGEE